MALEIYFSEDVAAALASVEQASKGTTAMAIEAGADPDSMRKWRQGHQSALVAMAAAFHLVCEGETLQDITDKLNALAMKRERSLATSG